MDHFERNFVKDCFVVVLLLGGKRNEKEKGCQESLLVELVPTGWCEGDSGGLASWFMFMEEDKVFSSCSCSSFLIKDEDERG